MKSIINIIILSLVLIPTILMAEKINKDRYKNYHFSPIYNTEPIVNNTTIILNQYLSEWRYLHKLHGVTVWGDKTVVAYTANLNSKYYSDWYKYREESLSKGIKYDPAIWSAVSVFDGTTHIVDLMKKNTDLFPNGHYANDYFGCIELIPLFTAKMIDDSPNALFSITGTGDIFNDGILDRLTLNIYDEDSNWTIHEDLFIANYNAYNIKDKNIDFDYYAYTTELPNDHPLVISNTDKRGRKKYAKLFVSDFNQDGLLEIIFWHRQYYSTLFKNPNKNGFILEKQWFTYYTENLASKDFKIMKIDIDHAIKILSDNDLSWSDGYPKNNRICKEKSHSPHPMMPLIIDVDIQVR